MVGDLSGAVPAKREMSENLTPQRLNMGREHKGGTRHMSCPSLHRRRANSLRPSISINRVEQPYGRRNPKRRTRLCRVLLFRVRLSGLHPNPNRNPACDTALLGRAASAASPSPSILIQRVEPPYGRRNPKRKTRLSVSFFLEHLNTIDAAFL